MKKQSFLCMLFAILFVPVAIFGQAAPTSSEAAELVAAAAAARPDIQEVLVLTQRSTKPWAKDVEAILHNTLALMDRIERAGAGMSDTKLRGFKTEMESLANKLDGIKNPDGQPLMSFLIECSNKCWEKYPKLWQTLRRIGCIVRCIMYL